MPLTLSGKIRTLFYQNKTVFALICGILVLSLLYPLVKDSEPFDIQKDKPPFFVWIFVIIMGTNTFLRGIINTSQIDNSSLFRKILVVVLTITAVSQILSIGIGGAWLFCATAFAYGIIKKRFCFPATVSILIFCYYLFQITGLIGSTDIHEALHILKQQIPLLALPLAFCCFHPSKKEWDIFLSFSFRLILVYLSSIILIYLLLTQYFGQSPFSAFSFNKFYLNTGYSNIISSFNILFWTHFTHPTYIFMGISAIFIATVTRQFLHKHQIISNIELGYGLICLFCFLFITQSRLSMVSFPLLIALFFIIKAIIKRGKKRFISILTISLCGGSFLFNGIMSSHFFARGTRSEMHKIALETIEQHPFTGIRLGSMGTLLQSHIKTETPKHPHNQFLSDGMQLGIPGVVILSILFIGLLLIAYKEKRYDFLLFLGVVLLVMSIEAPLLYVRGAYLLGFWLPLFAIVPRNNGSIERKKDDNCLRKDSLVS